jgi:hypothetical protein
VRLSFLQWSKCETSSLCHAYISASAAAHAAISQAPFLRVLTGLLSKQNKTFYFQMSKPLPDMLHKHVGVTGGCLWCGFCGLWRVRHRKPGFRQCGGDKKTVCLSGMYKKQLSTHKGLCKQITALTTVLLPRSSLHLRLFLQLLAVSQHNPYTRKQNRDNYKQPMA